MAGWVPFCKPPSNLLVPEAHRQKASSTTATQTGLTADWAITPSTSSWQLPWLGPIAVLRSSSAVAVSGPHWVCRVSSYPWPPAPLSSSFSPDPSRRGMQPTKEREPEHRLRCQPTSEPHSTSYTRLPLQVWERQLTYPGHKNGKQRIRQNDETQK